MRRSSIMSEKSAQPWFDVYRAITESIIHAIEAGAGTFTMPWHGTASSIAKPENAYRRESLSPLSGA
jgi:antirestriction protein ArdC